MTIPIYSVVVNYKLHLINVILYSHFFVIFRIKDLICLVLVEKVVFMKYIFNFMGLRWKIEKNPYVR